MLQKVKRTLMMMEGCFAAYVGVSFRQEAEMSRRVKRAKGLAFLVMVMLAALVCRLYYIQVMCQDVLDTGAKAQQVIQVQSEHDRGIIYDRNMIRLTDNCLSYYYLIEKKKETVGMEKLLNKINAEPAGAKGEDYVVYKTDTYDKNVNAQLIDDYGAYAFCGSGRYQSDQTAAHLIGYLTGKEKTGASGLEKMFQYQLASSPAMLTLTGNGAGAPVGGLGVSETEERKSISPSAVVTTLDAGLQQKVEEIMEERGISGSVVVLETSTGQVLAMASSPTFDPNRIDEYLDSAEGELINKATQGQYPPGSVFKIVVAAAALESGVVDEERTYQCKGSTEVNGVQLICDDHPDGHGTVNLEKAFALSCNGYFARLAKEIGSETIIDMAQRLGLGQTVIDGFPDEESGAFPSKEERVYSGLSNLAIGQGSLLTTPVQIARMTNIIACGGIDHEIAVTMREEKSQAQGKRVLTETTARRVGIMMEKVCEEGTGSSANLHVSAAGKTGSAESGEGKDYTVHGWFTGYFPAEDPEYTVTVVAENGKTGSSSALPVFEEIVNSLY